MTDLIWGMLAAVVAIVVIMVLLTTGIHMGKNASRFEYDRYTAARDTVIARQARLIDSLEQRDALCYGWRRE